MSSHGGHIDILIFFRFNYFFPPFLRDSISSIILVPCILLQGFGLSYNNIYSLQIPAISSSTCLQEEWCVFPCTMVIFHYPEDFGYELPYASAHTQNHSSILRLIFIQTSMKSSTFSALISDSHTVVFSFIIAISP